MLPPLVGVDNKFLKNATRQVVGDNTNNGKKRADFHNKHLLKLNASRLLVLSPTIFFIRPMPH